MPAIATQDTPFVAAEDIPFVATKPTCAMLLSFVEAEDRSSVAADGTRSALTRDMFSVAAEDTPSVGMGRWHSFCCHRRRLVLRLACAISENHFEPNKESHKICYEDNNNLEFLGENLCWILVEPSVEFCEKSLTRPSC